MAAARAEPGGVRAAAVRAATVRTATAAMPSSADVPTPPAPSAAPSVGPPPIHPIARAETDTVRAKLNDLAALRAPTRIRLVDERAWVDLRDDRRHDTIITVITVVTVVTVGISEVGGESFMTHIIVHHSLTAMMMHDDAR